MSSPAWNRRRTHQRAKTRTRRIRRLARRLQLVGWRVRWIEGAHLEHQHFAAAIDVNAPQEA